ncbi:MAG: lysophospholipid acyltransferase family protein [Acidobacteria bacterium]|nr:lysophospholipid acyltransferase family protein [Acidobacteriota bacterium]
MRLIRDHRNQVDSSASKLRGKLYYGAIGWIGWILIQLLARACRWQVSGYHHFRKLEERKLPVIFAFWHGRILPATFFWRNRGIVVLTSRNRDGEYIAHVIRRFGYGSSRGSSSRGAIKATISLLRTLKAGAHVAFTVDGPRGPRYQVQQGVTWLASYSGYPILPFHIEAKRSKTVSSWDGFQIPLPFSPIRVDIAEPIFLEKDLSEQGLEEKRIELEKILNRLRETAEAWVKRP